MKINPYIGHPSQISGIEEVRIIGGKGDGMRLLQLKNGKGLEMSICADRCADIYRLCFKGDNIGYFSANGYVAPAYYDQAGSGFLKSFTAGFLTTCGLSAVGKACVDNNETVPLHGTIGNTPCERIWWTEDDEAITIHAQINEARIFARKLQLNRVIRCSKNENVFTVTDTIENQGDVTSPLMLLYHMNMGYPLLSENAQLSVNSVSVSPRNDLAAEELSVWDQILPPTPGYKERCYYHAFDSEACASLYNPDINKGIAIRFDPKSLDHMTQWKLMRHRDYVLGLEPGNCNTDGRDVCREKGELKFLDPGKSITYQVQVELFEK